MRMPTVRRSAPEFHSRLVAATAGTILPPMQFIAPLATFLVLAALLTAGIVVAATKGSAILLLVAAAIFTGLFVKFGCLDHH